MTLKIVSNPYTREIKFYSYKDQSKQWEHIKDGNINSRLREDESGRNFLPFRIKEIIDTIISEYYVGKEKIHIFFEGTLDEYNEVENVCNEKDVCDKIVLSRTTRILENARHIFEPTKEVFAKVQPIIEKIVRDDAGINRNLNKVSDALKDIIPICVFGNYSAGKSTFINALIGGEILPSGGDPVTAKVYKIERSKYDDTAKVRFSYMEKPYEILFEDVSYRLSVGDIHDVIIQDIFNSISESKSSDLNSNISIALELLNGYEKKDKDDTVISNVLELEIPFSKSGILGQSYNNFVIFDTPGSNSESNAEHAVVLEEALEGFSNGIPVWISTYETLDSTDNANLCEKILDIKALDKRFTMIILNKADGSDLDEGGFSKKKEQEILEYNSVEKMYSSGIYFVSSIMGLGAKNNGILCDKHYRKTYRSQQEMYSNPDDEDYATLYMYNIMPHQIKKSIEKYSAECENLVYANSGLYCVEREMENFASKHAAYNKCQMVYIFLKEVIDETDRRIAEKTNRKRKVREDIMNRLETEKSELIERLKNAAKEADSDFNKDSKVFVKSHITENLDFHYELDELKKDSDKLHQENLSEHDFTNHEIKYGESRKKVITNVKDNLKTLFANEKSVSEKFSKIKADFVHDYADLKDSKKEMVQKEKEIDRETSDELMKSVIALYKKNLIKAQEILSSSIKQYWHKNSLQLREKLIDITTNSKALSESQQDELSKVIMSYQPISFNDDADNVFIKTRFLRGNFLGLQITDDEKLNIRKLAHSYNSKITAAVLEIGNIVNSSGYDSFRRWKESLISTIEENITKYNPDLRAMTDEINDYTEQINELEDNQAMIRNSLNAIEELMAWSELD